MKHSIFSCLVLLLLIYPVKAQSSLKSYLSKIQSAEEQIKQSRTKWKKTSVRQPGQKIDVEEFVAKHEAVLRKSGATEKYIREIARADRETAAEFMAGSQQATIFTCAHQENATWCEIASAPPVAIGASSSEPVSYNINYYDGKTSIVVDRAVLEPKQTAKDAFWMGSLKRNGDDVMRNVGIKNLSFLVGDPWSDKNLSGFRIVKESNDSVTLEKFDQEPIPVIKRLTFSKAHWRPILEETINSYTNKPLHRTRFMDYQFYKEGVWFPNKVISESFRGSGKAGSSESYELISAAFNSAADVSILQKPLPVGAIINDYRFDPRPGARYKIRKGGIPGDATVFKLVEEREANDVAENRQQQLSTARNFVLPLGALLMVGGFLWLRRSRANAT